MEKRRIVLGEYDTAAHGLWTLTEWTLSPPSYKSNFVSVPGHHGDLDLSTSLTDGVPVYNSRTLSATFESSEGTRLEREERINTMTNWLDGWSVNIQLPDDPLHYMTGRVSVARNYNDMAHASVTVTAVCDPWRYNAEETVVTLATTTDRQTAHIVNNGRRLVVPTLVIASESLQDYATLYYGENILVLYPGTYVLSDMVLNQGDNQLEYKGTGAMTLSLTYREAVL